MLQTAVGSLESSDCDTEWLVGINVVTGVGFVCFRQQLFLYSELILILSG